MTPMAKKRRRDEEEDYEEEEYEEEDEDERDEGGGMSRVVPYKNPFGLIAYYLGIFSLIPVLGVCLGPVAILLGILGFVKSRSSRKAKGTGHSIAGVVLGLAGLFIMAPLGSWLIYNRFFSK
jgi:hypothetical protein